MCGKFDRYIRWLPLNVVAPVFFEEVEISNYFEFVFRKNSNFGNAKKDNNEKAQTAQPRMNPDGIREKTNSTGQAEVATAFASYDASKRTPGSPPKSPSSINRPIRSRISRVKNTQKLKYPILEALYRCSNEPGSS